MSMYDADFRGTDLARHNTSTKGEKNPPGVKDPYTGGGDPTAADDTMGTGPGGTVTQGGKPDPEVSKQAERITGEPSPDPDLFDRELNKANETPSLTEGASKMVENIKSAFKSD